LQGLFRNPLAEPSVLGVSAGAALGAVFCLFSGIATRFVWAIPLGSFAGALLATLIVYASASRRAASSTGLLLVGIAVGQLAAALTSLVISFAVANYAIASQIVRWLLGGFEGRTWLHALWGLGPIVLGLGLSLREAKHLDALLLGEAGASALGVDVRQVRKNLIFAAALLTGASVAVGGNIAFVGLVVPHTLRRLLGSSHRRLLLASVLGGAGFLVFSDLLARTLIAPAELPIGVVTSVIGAPLFFKLAFQKPTA
jgi:iron complex transport system permease protein